MAHQVYREQIVDADEGRFLENATPSYYVLVYDSERPESGTLRIDLPHWAPREPRFIFSVYEPDNEEPREQVAIPSNQLTAALAALARAGRDGP